MDSTTMSLFKDILKGVGRKKEGKREGGPIQIWATLMAHLLITIYSNLQNICSNFTRL
jgi:hypothetical protein